MTSVAARRLAKLEGSLPPREAVLAWLVEAQQFASLDDHARSMVALPVEAAPLSVIGKRIEASVRASLKGQPSGAVRDAVRRAVGDGAFLFSLALLLNVQTHEFTRLEGLRATAVFFWMGSLLGGPRSDDLPTDEATKDRAENANAWSMWWSAVERLRLDAQVEREARATLEARYFGGHDVFFADAATAWAGHVDMVERLVKLAGLISSAHGPKRRRSSPSQPDGSLPERVEERVTRFADDARVRAYEIMGDRPRATAILERRLLGTLQ